MTAFRSSRIPRRPRMLNEPKKSRALFIVLAALLALAFAVLGFTLWWVRCTFTVNIEGTSMEDTLRDGDIVLALKNTAAERGDIVIIDVSDDPAFQTEEPTENIIKRVIAKEGDAVKCEGGVVYRKTAGGAWKALSEPYAKGGTQDFPETHVGEGEFFFLGDHRSVSKDSRIVGTRPCEKIIGVVPEWAVAHKGFIKGLENFRADLQAFFS